MSSHRVVSTGRPRSASRVAEIVREALDGIGIDQQLISDAVHRAVKYADEQGYVVTKQVAS